VDVVLAGPDHFHRLARFFGHQHGVDDELFVAMAAPAEAAAQERVVQLHFGARDFQHLGDGFLRHGLALRAAPDLGAIARRRYRATAFNGSICA